MLRSHFLQKWASISDRAILHQIRDALMEPIDETLHQGILTLATAAATARSLPGGQRLRVYRGLQASVAHQG